MADKTIGELPQAPQVNDDSLFVMEQQGAAMKMTGAQIRAFAEDAGKMGAHSIAKGATYTPHVTDDGDLSWTNDQGLDNPEPVNVKGPPGGVNSFNGRAGDVVPEAGDYTAADVGAPFSGYITDNSNVDTLQDGVYLYNGWASGNITCSVVLPFTSSYGIWIKKTPYNSVGGKVNRHDAVIATGTGRIYTMEDYSGVWREGYLPLTGGTLTGNVRINDGPNVQVRFCNTTDGAGALLLNNGHRTVLQSLNVFGDGTNHRSLGVSDSANSGLISALRLDDRANNVSTYYKLFGEHNKPSGTYTGNGSAAGRSIQTGGVGRALLIVGNGFSSIVTTSGAIVWANNGQTYSLSGSEIDYYDGKLKIATTSPYVNKVDIAYSYQVL